LFTGDDALIYPPYFLYRGGPLGGKGRGGECNKNIFETKKDVREKGTSIGLKLFKWPTEGLGC